MLNIFLAWLLHIVSDVGIFTRVALRNPTNDAIGFIEYNEFPFECLLMLPIICDVRMIVDHSRYRCSVRFL
ncbi:hypothetical protein BDV34DRAFT_193349 [Aspergillus parasiticus]|uniref:Uncharacterized protein n=1 Tax=Aspergillus parasiticus TaxID=5067 RepID=A0A5N6DNP9_ASPPA|nr:hypothetical protein BDV34DRAFT_193349 [Aspergillus parasiticus]